MFNIVNNEIKISVRNLVEFLCKTGDIDKQASFIADGSAMDAGSRIHRKIQKSMGSEYASEVFLKTTVEYQDYRIEIEGRADGIFPQRLMNELDEIYYIDEIKGTYKDVHYMEKALYVHKAQAMCYAYMYGIQNKLEKVGLQLTYVNIDNEHQKKFQEIISINQLEEWFDELLSKLVKWTNFLYDHKNQRTQSIQELKFPYEYRPGQRNLAVNVFRAISQNKNLFLQAPTGVGKTLSTIYPSIMAMGQNKVNKIFYLTAKTITRTAAEEAFFVLRKQKMHFNTLTITAKDKICFKKSEERVGCNPRECQYAKGYFDKVNKAVYDIIIHEENMDRKTVEKYALKHGICPFEFELDISYWVDGVICDYNYVFDPHVSLKRFFSGQTKEEYVFLVDEAHNLVNRAREMYSAHIYKEDFLNIKNEISINSKALNLALDRCNRNLLELKKSCDDNYRVIDSDDNFALNMLRLGEELVKFLEIHSEFQERNQLVEFYFRVFHYNLIHEELDENYVIYNEHTDQGFMIRLFCVNPSMNLKERLIKGRSTVFFSATLLPIRYFKELLSGNTEDYAVYTNSPFDIQNRLLIIGNDVSSRYKQRTKMDFLKIRNYIIQIVQGKNGNYMVFFPSYQYMNQVVSEMLELGDNEKYNILQQKSDMSEKEKEEFLDQFKQNTKGTTLIGMCVIGGIFSEGIDLKQDRLIGSIIVGTGIPHISTTQQILRKYYDDRNGCGYEYAYIYPGMNKVLQAAGRVIRTDEDKGVIALLDNRFLTNIYANLFPNEWSNYRITYQNKVSQEVLDFWGDMIYNS